AQREEGRWFGIYVLAVASNCDTVCSNDLSPLQSCFPLKSQISNLKSQISNLKSQIARWRRGRREDGLGFMS
ncbi:hypothetical protein QUB08_11430, partial [Microcoleus sp. BR0-C5]|uniref:hypothetical protein n=1 Tax=Microcoleus sp. BR0-C5 TaxID=2818713 RepID=UPI002FD1FDC5